MDGTIFNIQRFSVGDGEGIRTTVFFMGCPLSCAWCHNPESRHITPILGFDKDKCTCCRRCTCRYDVHTFEETQHLIDRRFCNNCGKCVENCPNGALELIGYRISSQKILQEVVRDRAFYEESGGGMTLSGGEPMMQPAFALELAKGAKAEGIGVCIETCGYCDGEKLLSILPYTDTFLYDYKVSGSKAHQKYTGVPNELILQNLRLLNENGAQIILRCPIIPGINNTKEHMKAILNIALSLKQICEINLMPYHALGRDKALRVGQIPFGLKTSLSADDLAPLADILREQLVIPVKIE